MPANEKSPDLRCLTFLSDYSIKDEIPGMISGHFYTSPWLAFVKEGEKGI